MSSLQKKRSRGREDFSSKLPTDDTIKPTSSPSPSPSSASSSSSASHPSLIRQRTLTAQARDRSRREPNPECLALMEQAFRLFEGGHPGQVSPSQVREICASLGVPFPHSLDGPEERLVGLASYMTAMRKALWKRGDHVQSF